MIVSERSQRGAVLVVALIMLLVITVLAVTSMRSVSLESKIVANVAQAKKKEHIADAALREGEFRLYGPAYVRDKLESNMAANCTKNNKLRVDGLNKPCLLSEVTRDELKELSRNPLVFLREQTAITKGTGAHTEAAADSDIIAWMPYKGLDANNYFSGGEIKSYWNIYRIMDGSEESNAFNAEYGDAMQGKGTFFFLVNGQADDEVAFQSTVSTIYLGLE